MRDDICLKCNQPHPPLADGEIPRDIVSALVETITQILVAHDRNFCQGNPSVFVSPTDLRGVEVRTVIALGEKGKINAGKPRIWTPNGRG